MGCHIPPATDVGSWTTSDHTTTHRVVVYTSLPLILAVAKARRQASQNRVRSNSQLEHIYP